MLPAFPGTPSDAEQTVTGESAFDSPAEWQPFEPQPSDPASAEDQSDLPGLPAFPGAQPWEVAGDDAAPYDWFADPQGPPRPMRGRLPRNLGAQPGTPSPSPRPSATGTPSAGSTPPRPGGQPPAHTLPPGAQLPSHSPEPGTQPPSHAPGSGAQPPWQSAAPQPGGQPSGPQPSWQHAEPEPDAQAPGRPNTGWSPAAGAWPAPIPEEPATWAVEPVVPGAPSWEPPPAFTAAAAGMQVWPAPVSDPPAMPPWPAATGELAVEPEADDVSDPTSPWNVPSDNSPPDDAPTRPGGIIPPGAPTSGDGDPAPKSSVYGGPTTKGPAFGQPAADYEEGDPSEDAEDYQTDPNLTAPFDARGASARPFAANEAVPPAFDPNTTAPTFDATAPHAFNPSTGAPGTFDPNTTAPAFDPNATAPASGATAPHALGPNARPHAFDASTPPPAFDPNAAGHPAEPSDVPVWPPIPPGGPEQKGKVPDLPFEVWGQKPTPALPVPASQDRSTPPQGLPAPYGQGPFKQSPFQATPPVAGQPGKPAGRKALFITLGVLALAGVATGGFFAYKSVSAPAPNAATTAAKEPPTTAPPAIVSPDASTTPVVPATSILNSEQTDPRKMSLSEAFPKKKIEAEGAVFSKVKTDMTSSCDKAASGPFADALREQKCSRIVRATYVDTKRRYAVTTGIAVLPTKEAAMSADKAKNLGRNVWFRGLPSAAGTGGERVEIAGGYAAGLVWGRYIVFSYATYADGHTPGTKEKTLGKVSGAFRDQTSQALERRLTND
ncbi:hypothetical protein [Nonomuraea aurantiaca]|uniref:hypothetical protein n=1 Tax=Nonomuraea aurantiaca TaxID=2878562 RepID=UPI001CD94F5C|nr:hypothetical protein [Nonomuraea aurantiaca]MCA2224493.1 hypothetical protein [Nonomuraea aurantiaca]